MRLFFAVLCALMGMHSAMAEIRFTDLAGREVVLEKPAETVLLGEGRFLAALGVLGVEQPLDRVAGMMNEFHRFDPATYARYQDVFPHIEAVPTFGETSEDSVSVEQAILTQPDVAIFGVAGHGPSSSAHYIVDRLEDAGIQVVFIDFRQDPLNHTVPSMLLLGQVLGEEAAAERFAQRYQSELAKVTERLAQSPPAHRPRVLLDVWASTDPSCCFSIAKGMFADMIDAAGGDNIASALLSGSVGELSLEHILAVEPEVYIGTATGTLDERGQSPRIVLGPGVSVEDAQRTLDSVLRRPVIASLPAVQNQRAHGLWHHFYNSPLNIYALQKIAQWLHPELFADLEPEALLDDLLLGFAPVEIDGTYAVSIGE